MYVDCDLCCHILAAGTEQAWSNLEKDKILVSSQVITDMIVKFVTPE